MNLIEKQKNLNEEARKFCQDINNYLDERWQLVLNFGNTTHSINFGFPEIDIILDNNYLHYNRWEVYSVDSILHDLKQFEWEELDSDTLLDESKFKEYCCQNFISKMQYSKFLSL